jgi:hypothetical protein
VTDAHVFLGLANFGMQPTRKKTRAADAGRQTAIGALQLARESVE